MSWQRADTIGERILHHLVQLLICGAMIALIVVAIKVVPVLNHAVLLLDEVKKDVQEFNQTAKTANTMLANTDRNLNAEPFGVLPEAKQVAKHAAATVKVIAQTSLAERARMTAQADRLDSILKHTDELVVKAGADLDKLTVDGQLAIQALTRALDGLPPTIEQAQEVLAAAKELIADPEIKRAILELANSTKNVDEITASLAKIADDVQVKVHGLTHPTKAQKVVSGALTAVKFLYYVALALK